MCLLGAGVQEVVEIQEGSGWDGERGVSGSSCVSERCRHGKVRAASG